MIGGQRVSARPVVDGRRVRWTLEQVAARDQALVRVDWLRFTLPLDHVSGGRDVCELGREFLAALDQRGRELVAMARGVEVNTGGAMWVAREGARRFCEWVQPLAGGFEVGTVEDKGLDFYEARCAVMFEGAVVGYVLAGGKSSAQAATVHFNIFGGGCLHLSHANWLTVRDVIEQARGWITRVDLALDVFEGDEVTAVPAAYLAGAFDVRGKRPEQTEHGSWTNGHSRTFQVGKRETGKCLRAYEKGDEQFGADVGDPWVRYEVEFRNSARVIDLDVLARPADFFAGAYPFCEALLERLSVECAAQRIPTASRVKDATEQAAAVRVYRWLRHTAMPSVGAVFELGGDLLADLLRSEADRWPARLSGFSRESVREAFEKVAAGLAPSAAPFAAGAI